MTFLIDYFDLRENPPDNEKKSGRFPGRQKLVVHIDILDQGREDDEVRVDEALDLGTRVMGSQPTNEEEQGPSQYCAKGLVRHQLVANFLIPVQRVTPAQVISVKGLKIAGHFGLGRGMGATQSKYSET